MLRWARVRKALTLLSQPQSSALYLLWAAEWNLAGAAIYITESLLMIGA